MLHDFHMKIICEKCDKECSEEIKSFPLYGYCLCKSCYWKYEELLKVAKEAGFNSIEELISYLKTLKVPF
jgi:hypothetical protein